MLNTPRSLFAEDDVDKTNDDRSQLISFVRHAYRIEAKRSLLEICLSQGEATTDEVQARVPLPRGVHPSNLGLAISELSSDGLIEMGGVTLTNRSAGRGRLIRRWHLKDAVAAQSWLSKASAQSEVL